jgi:hypothetical protein
VQVQLVHQDREMLVEMQPLAESLVQVVEALARLEALQRAETQAVLAVLVSPILALLTQAVVVVLASIQAQVALEAVALEALELELELQEPPIEAVAVAEAATMVVKILVATVDQALLLFDTQKHK